MQVFKAQLDGMLDVAVKGALRLPACACPCRALLVPGYAAADCALRCAVLQAKGGLEGKDLLAFQTEVAVLHTCRHDCIVHFVGAYLGRVRPLAARLGTLCACAGCKLRRLRCWPQGLVPALRRPLPAQQVNSAAAGDAEPCRTQEHYYLVQELMAGDLHRALNCPLQAEMLRWHAKCACAGEKYFLLRWSCLWLARVPQSPALELPVAGSGASAACIVACAGTACCLTHPCQPARSTGVRGRFQCCPGHLPAQAVARMLAVDSRPARAGVSRWPSPLPQAWPTCTLLGCATWTCPAAMCA